MRATQQTSIVLVIAGLAATAAAIAEPADPVEALKACAAIEDADARLACFDGIGDRVRDDEPAAAGPAVTETPAEPVPAPAAEKKPAATSETSPPAEPAPATAPVSSVPPVEQPFAYAGKITSCKQGHYGNWIFAFDDGQVWKEVRVGNLRFRNCEFDATITKDTFGYKLYIDGRKQGIPVTRTR